MLFVNARSTGTAAVCNYNPFSPGMRQSRHDILRWDNNADRNGHERSERVVFEFYPAGSSERLQIDFIERGSLIVGASRR